MADTPLLKIVVSCHREFPIPDSDVYLPVQVGAGGAARRIPGMQADDEGENISDRNFTFCELSAQYWAWKNLEADFVGQCHYRRYFCFGDVPGDTNDHAQLEVAQLTDVSAHALGLDDGALVRRKATQADITTGHWWDVRGVPTPRGASRNVAEHMTSYGLYAEEDLRVLREIVAERQPEYLFDLDAYLGGSKYLGYNCFVMRREAFDELCSFEFDVLLEFDRRKDYAGLTRNQRRICGYLGEVLYSSFVKHVQRTGSYLVQECPLVFFDAVTPALKLGDETSEDAHGRRVSPEPVRLVWNATDLFFPDNWSREQRETMSYVLPASLAVSLRSLFDHVNADRRYHVTLVVRPEFLFARFWNALGTVPKNVTVDLTTWVPLRGHNLCDLYGEEALYELLPALFAWSYQDVSARLLWLDGLAAFCGDPATALDAYRAGEGIMAACGMRFEKEFTRPGSFGDVSRSWRAAFATWADSRLCVVDLADVRARWSLDDLRAIMDREGFANFHHGPRDESFACDALLSALGVSTLPYELAYPSLHIEDTQNWGSAESVAAWERAPHGGVILIEDCPVPSTNVDFSANETWWEAARSTRGYENLLMHASADFANATAVPLRDKLLPKGSKRRQMAGRVLRIVKDSLR